MSRMERANGMEDNGDGIDDLCWNQLIVAHESSHGKEENVFVMQCIMGLSGPLECITWEEMSQLHAALNKVMMSSRNMSCEFD